MILAASATLYDIAAGLACLGLLSVFLTCLIASFMHAGADEPVDTTPILSAADACRDRDGMIAERSALTPTLVHQSSGVSHAKRFRLDRTRRAHPND